MDSQTWILLCNDYDEMSEEERSKISFDDFLRSRGYNVKQGD